MFDAVQALNALDTRLFDSVTASSPQHDNNADYITVPDAHLLFNGDFKRVGTSGLKITAEDGKSFFIEDYFGGEKHKHLLSPEGALLTANVVDALAGPLAPGQFAQAGAQSASQPVIGRVDALTGSATVVRNGVSVALNIGDLVRKGDVVQTAASSSVSIVLVDSSTFSLSPNARMVLNDFVYDTNASNNSAVINLVQGTFGFVAGQVAKTGDMRVETPVATMGIRGTAVLVEISANNGNTKFSVMVEPNGVTGSFNLYDKVNGSLLATVNNSSTGWVVNPVGPLQVLASQVQKTPGELQFEIGVVQQLFNIINNYQLNPITDSERRSDLPNGPQNAGGSGSGNPITGDVQKVTLSEIITQYSQTNPVGGGGTPPQTNIQIPLPPDDSIRVTITPNRPPIAINDPAGSPSGGDVIPNDSDPDGDAIQVVRVQHLENDVPTGPIVTVPQNGQSEIQGKYGKLTVKSDGTYTFTPNEEFKKLALNQAALDKFQYTISDPFGATASAILSVALTGENDAPVITGGNFVGAITASAGAGPVSGTLTKTDIDNDDNDGNDVWSLVADTGHGQTQDGTTSVKGIYGTLSIDANGKWTYTLYDSAVTKALTAADHPSETFQVVVTDSHGASATKAIVITVDGANDAPTTVDDHNTVKAAGNVHNAPTLGDPLATGNVLGNDTDIDSGDSLKVVGVQTGDHSGSPAAGHVNSIVQGKYGYLVLLQTGGYVYTLNNFDPDTIALREGQTATETFTYTIEDESGAKATALLTIDVKGANSVPIITGTSTGQVTEDAVANSVSRTLGNFDPDNDGGNDTWSLDPRSGQIPLDDATVQGKYGTLTVNQDGKWTYLLDNSLTATQALGANEHPVETFTVRVTDAHGDSDTETIRVTVNGANDAPVIAPNNISGFVTEDAVTNIATGALSKSDVDNDDIGLSGAWSLVADTLHDQSQDSTVKVTGTYGALAIDPNGNWTYTLNNSLAATQALNASDHKVESFTVKVTDSHGASDTETITVTVNGADDNHAPVAVNDTFLNVPLGWTLSSDNHLYKYVSDSAISWFEAKNAAQAAGGYLATITSDAENNIVFSLVGNDVAWLGGADAAVEGQWRWITEPGYASGSEPLFYNNTTHWSSYAHWAGGEPNDRGDGIYLSLGEDYLATWGNKTWNDLDNSSSDLQLVDGYVIERNGTSGANYLQITEDAPTNIAKSLLLANDTDSDNDLLAVSLAGGSGAGVGTSHLGATVQLSGNNFVYNPVGSQALQALGAGQTAQDYFYYQIDDGHGGTATAKVTVTVNGLNDAPDRLHFVAGSSMTAAEETNGLDDYRTLGNVAAVDPDAGDHLTYSLGSGSSSKFTLSDDGTLRTGSSDVGGGTYSLNLIATDEFGASTTEKLTAWVGSSSGNTKSFASQSNDVLAFGLGGSDIITGSAHDDTLSGGGGSDTLKGGSGNDTLIGGADRDTFIFGLNDGHDTITDMKLGTASNADIIRLEGITSGQVQIVENTLTDDIRIVIGTNHIDLAGVDYNTTNVNLLTTHNLIFA